MPPTRRQRPKACDSCWHRKIRCDTRKGPCRNCETYNVSCKVTRGDGEVLERLPVEGSPDAGGPHCSPRGLVDSPSGRSLRHQSLELNSHPPSIPTPVYSDQVRRYDPVRRSTLPRSPQSPDRPPTPLVTSPTVFGLSNRSLEGVVTIEKGLSPRLSKYAGKVSPQVLAKSAEELFQDEEIRIRVMEFYRPLMSFQEEIPMAPSTYTPSVQKFVAMQHIEVFFSSINSLFPILPRKDFMSMVEEFYYHGRSTSPSFICSLYMTLALGARSEGLHDQANAFFAAGWDLYGRVVSMPYLSSVQALLLIALELMSCNKEGQAILAVGTAVRIAQSLGLHRSLSAHKQPRERGFIEKEYDFRTRIWWVCYCLDKKLSFEVGRPSSINDIECDVDLPRCMQVSPGFEAIPEDDELFESMIQLCQIQSAILSRLFCRPSISQEDNFLVQEIEELDGHLVEWKEKLPSPLRVDEQLVGVQSGAKSAKYVLLHCMYYNTMLVTHRAALFGEAPLQPSQRTHPRMMGAEAICLNSARSLARLLNDLVRTSGGYAITGWTSSYIVNVAFTLYIGIMKNPTKWTSETDVTFIKTLPNCFSKSCNTSFAVSSFDELCTSLLHAIDVMRRRSLQSVEASRPVAPQPEGSSFIDIYNEGLPQELSHDIDFRFGDFFGMCGTSDPLSSMQMWPVRLDETVADEFPVEG